MQSEIDTMDLSILSDEAKEIMRQIRDEAASIRAKWRAQQKKKHRNEKTRQQYKRRTLQQTDPEQCSTENLAEKPTASYSISTVNTSQPFSVSHQAVKHFDRESASHHSSSKIHGCNSFRLRFLKKPYHYTELVSPLAYIRHAEEMEATGQG